MTQVDERLVRALDPAYTIVRELGRGGMATVYLVHDRKHDRRVALKVLLPELGAALGAERFQREIRLAARLQHPHVLPVFDSGDADGRLWYTMPFVEGESLRDRLVRERQLPVEEAVRIVREAAQGLHYAHRQGIVHRDVKPENLLLAEDGTTLVADFGIARALAGAGVESAAKLTGTGLAIGTPAYMSPEQAVGEQNIDARTDVYSLAAVLYEALAGEPPFTGSTPQAILAKRFVTPAPSVRVLRPTVSAELEAVLARALATAPADRFSTAAEFGVALAQPSTGGTGSGAAMKSGSRSLLPLAAAVVLVIAVATGAWLLSHRSSGATSTDARDGALAVLPFENLGDSTDAYFAEGVADEIRGKLAALPQLRVIASASSRQYRGTRRSPSEIARELGVRYLLVGRIRWQKIPGSPSRVRVDPELVDVTGGQSPATTWQQPFDAELSDVFRVQSEIAQEVASELRVALGAREQAALASVPTRSLDAYDAYLRGLEARYGGGSDANALYRAAKSFRDAVTLDSTFARAWVYLSNVYVDIACCAGGPRVYADSARLAMERARSLSPALPAAAAAEAYYRGKLLHDWKRAHDIGVTALSRSPNDATLMMMLGITEGALGKWEEQNQRFRQVLALDPRSAAAAANLGLGETFLGHLPEARAALDRALALQPGRPDARAARAEIEVEAGDTARAHTVIRELPASLDRTPVLVQLSRRHLTWLLDDAEQRQLLALTPAAFGGNRGYWGMALADLYRLRGDSARSRAYADSAHVGFSRLLAEDPHQVFPTFYDAMVLGIAGRRAEAVAALARVADPSNSTGDVTAEFVLRKRVWPLLDVGERERAIAELEAVQRSPARFGQGRLRYDPHFAALRGDPRFERLITAR